MTLENMQKLIEQGGSSNAANEWQTWLEDMISAIPDTFGMLENTNALLNQAFPAPPIDFSTADMANWAARVVTKEQVQSDPTNKRELQVAILNLS